MKALLFLPLALCAAFFTWRWLISHPDKVFASLWLKRLALAVAFALAITLLLFATLSLNSWKIW